MNKDDDTLTLYTKILKYIHNFVITMFIQNLMQFYFDTSSSTL